MLSAVIPIASAVPQAMLCLVGTSLAFGLTVTAMAYVVAPQFRQAPQHRRATRMPATLARRSEP